MIREATHDDIAAIVTMGRAFLHDGPYHDIIEDHPEVPTRLAERLLEHPGGKILVDEENGELTGVVAFIVYEHFYSGQPTAQELIWYVRPENRQSFTPIILLRAAQRYAKDMGAKYMQFTAPTVEVGKLYEMSGYKQIEVGYQRAL